MLPKSVCVNRRLEWVERVFNESKVARRLIIEGVTHATRDKARDRSRFPFDKIGGWEYKRRLAGNYCLVPHPSPRLSLPCTGCLLYWRYHPMATVAF